MEFTLFDITFDNASLVFQPGQRISGNVLLELNAPKYVKGLKLKLEGRGQVLWKKQRNRRYAFRRRKPVALYHADEIYLRLKLELLDTGPCMLMSGSYEFLFYADLPDLLPSTYRTQNAIVEYDAEAILTLDEYDRVCSLPFVVINPFDLNTCPRINEPVCKRVTKNIVHFCCLNGTINLTVILRGSGFVPGQTIPIFFEVDNTSGVSISNIKIYLIQKTRLTSVYPFEENKTLVTCLAVRQLAGIIERSTSMWNESLQVPKVPIPNLRSCNIIAVTYEIRIKVVPSGLHGNASLTIPIQLADIPFTPDVESLIVI